MKHVVLSVIDIENLKVIRLANIAYTLDLKLYGIWRVEGEEAIEFIMTLAIILCYHHVRLESQHYVSPFGFL